MTDDRKSRPYSVGYSKPPQHTKFVNGQIANPKGRPKGSKNFKTQLREELKKPASFTENGKRRKTNKQGAFAVQLVNKGVGGDPKTMPLLLNEIRHLEANSGEGAGQSEPLTQKD